MQSDGIVLHYDNAQELMMQTTNSINSTTQTFPFSILAFQSLEIVPRRQKL